MRDWLERNSLSAFAVRISLSFSFSIDAFLFGGLVYLPNASVCFSVSFDLCSFRLLKSRGLRLREKWSVQLSFSKKNFDDGFVGRIVTCSSVLLGQKEGTPVGSIV